MTFEEVMDGFLKKRILQTVFQGEKLAIYLGKIISCTEKNIGLDVYNTEKNLRPLHVRETISEKNSYPN